MIDLAPTLLNVAGTPPPIRSEFPRVDLLPVIEIGIGTERTLFWEHFGHHVIRQGRWKLVGDPDENLPELYDLITDPTEESNFLDEHWEKQLNWQRYGVLGQ